ncbi:TPA: hypothetical protein N0F65_002656, partial [Lagenidium giganteum]
CRQRSPVSWHWHVRSAPPWTSSRLSECVRSLCARSRMKSSARPTSLSRPTTGVTAPGIPLDALAVGEMNAKQIGQIFRFSVYGNLVAKRTIGTKSAGVAPHANKKKKNARVFLVYNIRMPMSSCSCRCHICDTDKD